MDVGKISVEQREARMHQMWKQGLASKGMTTKMLHRISPCWKNLLSKSTSPQTNDGVRGLRQEVLTAGATYDGGDMRLLYNGA